MRYLPSLIIFTAGISFILFVVFSQQPSHHSLTSTSTLHFPSNVTSSHMFYFNNELILASSCSESKKSTFSITIATIRFDRAMDKAEKTTLNLLSKEEKLESGAFNVREETKDTFPPLFAEEIDGKVVQFLPGTPNSHILVYSLINNENIKYTIIDHRYYTRIYNLTSTTNDISTHSKSTHDTSINRKTQLLPGSLGFSRMAYSQGVLVYIRKDDEYSFRTISHIDSSPLSSTSTLISIPGVSKSDYSGRNIAFQNLDPNTIFTVNYDPVAANRVTVSLHLFSKAEDNIWSMKTLWDIDVDITDDVIETKDIDRLYFLSNPILAQASDGCVAFVFLESLFIVQKIEDVWDVKVQSLEGEMHGSDFDVEGIYFTHGGEFISIVSEVE